MMTALVAYPSTHESTAEVARQIADRLSKAGLAAAARPASAVTSLQSYHAVVLGSALHDQAWLPEAVEFLTRFASNLPKRPVWLFSTCDVALTRDLSEAEVTALYRRSHVPESTAAAHARETIPFRGHHSFAGAFEPGRWRSFGDLFSKVCGGASSDHRDWHDINEWADSIARQLHDIDHVEERRRLHLSVRGRP